MKKIISIILGLLLLGTTNAHGWTIYGKDVELQKVTPGEIQTGNFNISGVGIVKDFTVRDTTPSLTLTDTTSGDDSWSINVDADIFSIKNETTGLTAISIAGSGAVTIATTNANGLTFGSLGTATRGIDLSGSGLSGDTDYLIYGSASLYFTASGISEALVFRTGGGAGYFQADSSGYSSIIYSVRSTLYGLSSTGAGLFGNYTAVGSLTSCTSNGTATITKVGHGLTLAVGEIVHITGATTTVDKDFYRIVSSTVDTIVVNRVLSGSDADVALTIYKDVIGMFAADSNGQGIRAFGGTQDKPLILGGTVNPATGHSLTSTDVLIAGTAFEVDPPAYFDSAVTLAVGGYVAGNLVFIGSGEDFLIGADVDELLFKSDTLDVTTMTLAKYGVVGHLPYDNTATPVAPTSAAKQFPYYITLADDAIATLYPITSNAWIFVTVGTDVAERGIFVVDSTGTVTSIASSANMVVNADTDAKFCIGTAATQEPLQIKNRLGSSQNVMIYVIYN